MRDDSPVVPDLFFLPGAVLPIMDQQNTQDDDADDIRFCVVEKITQLHIASCCSFRHSDGFFTCRKFLMFPDPPAWAPGEIKLNHCQHNQRKSGFPVHRVYGDLPDKGMDGFPVLKGFMQVFPAAGFPAAGNCINEGTAEGRIRERHDGLLTFCSCQVRNKKN